MSEQTVVPEWTLGERLAKARRSADMSREDMASYLGLSIQAIGTYETGRHQPKLAVLRAWAQRAAVPFDWLCLGEPSTRWLTRSDWLDKAAA
jgi:transcriptional regulator with XRE-family HTH domain